MHLPVNYESSQDFFETHVVMHAGAIQINNGNNKFEPLSRYADDLQSLDSLCKADVHLVHPLVLLLLKFIPSKEDKGRKEVGEEDLVEACCVLVYIIMKPTDSCFSS